MNFGAFVTILMDTGLDISVSKAKNLYTAMGFDPQVPISQDNINQCQSTYNADEVIVEFGVQLALRTESILNSISNGKKISALKEVRELARDEWGIPMTLALARKVVENSRVLDRAMLPEWERALLGWDRPLIPKC